MKIIIVAGFLGSGKTTFINKIVKERPDDYMIIENEYAQVNIDADLLKTDKKNIFEMTDGCICCTRNVDLGDSVVTISNTYNPNYLIIEPTGVAGLSTVLSSIKKVEYERIQIQSVVTLVDVNSFIDYMKNDEPFFKDQLENANIVLLTKTDKFSEDMLRGIKEAILEVNPKAKCFAQTNFDIGKIFEVNEDIDILKSDTEEMVGEEADLDQLTLIGIEEKNIDRLGQKIYLILRGTFGEVIRAKGLLPVNKQWTRLDIVAKTYSVETIEEQEESKLVIIGRNLNKKYLKQMFEVDDLF